MIAGSKNKIRRRWLATAGAFLLCVISPLGPVAAQTGDMDARLSRMERDIETLSRSVFKGEKLSSADISVGSGGAAYQEQTDARLSQMETDLRELTGRIEEQGNLLNQINRTLSDIQIRLNKLEGAGATAGVVGTTSLVTTDQPPVSVTQSVSSATAPATAETSAMILTDGPNGPASTASPSVQNFGTIPQNMAAVPVENDPARAYENAIALLKQRDYGAAERAFQDFLKNNPEHTLAPNAKYWMGESYFAQSKYDQAARVFAEGYQKYPKGAKAADNLLKLGLSLSALNNKDDACVALLQISKDFPNGAAAVRTRAEQEIRKLKCGG